MQQYAEYPRFQAGGAIHTNRFIIQDTSAGHQVLQATAAHALVVGVSADAGSRAPLPNESSPIQAAYAAGDQVQYHALGGGRVVKIAAGAAVAIGAKVTPDANGKAVAVATGQYAYGQALRAASAADELIPVFLYGCGQLQP